MEFKAALTHLEGVPYISKKNAKILYDFIIRQKPEEVLELGFAHGTSSCYIAAALEENKKGRLTTVDLYAGKKWQVPSIEELLDKLDLKRFVEIHRMKTGYNWFLHDEIKAQTNRGKCTPKYDLIIIDGPKNWTIDSSSFFLCDKLLKRTGWIIWDDYNWTYWKANEKRSSTAGVQHRDLSEEELKTPHIREIFELLVMQHPKYGNFRVHSRKDWAWAQKIGYCFCFSFSSKTRVRQLRTLVKNFLK